MSSKSLTTRSRTQDSNGLDKCERAVLSVLAQYRDGCRSGKLALLAGYSYSGGFRNALSKLRTAGLILGKSNTSPMSATDDLFTAQQAPVDFPDR